ncbi:hypothetical protein [Rhodopila sp.]|uniref:hypothetical protein n=1 Tax=Rhodopila sp. TaxID=2480087 RepID=UPI003D0CC908
MDWLRHVWAAAWASDVKWTDVAIVLFTFGQVWIGIQQAKIARRQTGIADETRDIAVSALGRPYVFIERVTHNYSDCYRGDSERLRFIFQLVNHGSGPAVILGVFADVILSPGPISLNRQEESPLTPFPPKTSFPLTGYHIWSAYTKIELRPQEESWRYDSIPFILRAGESSRIFESEAFWTFPRPETPDYNRLPFIIPSGHHGTAPWLIASVRYESPFGTKHHTGLSARGRMNSGADPYNEKPFTDRT